MKLVYTLFILVLSTLAARAESRVSDSVACAPTSVMLANDTVAKQKALGKEYKLTADWKKHKRFKTAGYCVLCVGRWRLRDTPWSRSLLCRRKRRYGRGKSGRGNFLLCRRLIHSGWQHTAACGRA